MTTGTPNTNNIYGVGAPVALAPKNTLYFDTTNAAAYTAYISTGTGWVILGLSGSVVLPPGLVGDLPAAAAGNLGWRGTVTDSNAVSITAGIGTVVATGGATVAPVFSDGADWRIA